MYKKSRCLTNKQEDLSTFKIHSLEDVALLFVARNLCFYRIDTIKDLSRPVLERLASYLSAYQLNRLHDVFCEAGLSLRKIWKKHLAFHWSRKSDRSATIFKTDSELEKCLEPRSRFLERLFQKIFGNLESESVQYLNLTLMPKCSHGLIFHCTDLTTLTGDALHAEILDYASHVRVLTVAATSYMIKYLLHRRSLLDVLQRCVQRLDVYRITDANFSDVKALVAAFVYGGCLSEFSIFSSSLSSVGLNELLAIVSGLKDVCLCNRVWNENISVMDREFHGCLFEGKTENLEFEIEDELSSDRDENRKNELDCCVSEPTAFASDDLFDIALTSSLKSQLQTLPCSNTLVRDFHSNGASRLHLSSLPNSHSTDVFPVTGHDVSGVFPTESFNSRRKTGGCLSQTPDQSFLLASESESISSRNSRHNVSTFALAYFIGDQLLEESLVECLTNWKHLRRLALIDISGGQTHSADDSEYPTEFDDCVRNMIVNGNLTHISVCGLYSFVNVYECIFSALVARENTKPMAEISLHDCQSTTITLPTDIFRGGVSGVTFFDISDSLVNGAVLRVILLWIRNDRALRCVHLPCFNLNGLTADVLEAVRSNSGIEELNLRRRAFDLSCGRVLCSVIQTLSSLRKLNLSKCSLSKETFDDVESFVKALCAASSLQELNLEANELGEVACRILKGLCSSKTSGVPYELIDLSYNQIDGEALIETLAEIRRSRARFPIEQLNLSGNLLKGMRDLIVYNFADCVNVLIANDPQFAYPAGSLADHISQM